MAIKLNVLLGPLCLAVMTGCGPQLPEYRDPLADLSSARAADAPENAPVKVGSTVAITLGSNVERFLKYYDEGRAYAASVGASKQLLAEGDPQYLVDGAVAVIRRRYPKVRTVEDLASAARQRFATTFVVDIRTKAGMYPGDKTTSDITIIALDAQQKPISRITAHGEVEIRPYVPPQIREANDQALRELSGKAERLLN